MPVAVCSLGSATTDGRLVADSSLNATIAGIDRYAIVEFNA